MGIGHAPGEMLHQNRQIFDPLPERRKRNRKSSDPIEEFVIEISLVGELLQVFIGGADQAKAVAVVAQHADQLLLHWNGERVEMLEEQCAAFRLLHPRAAGSVNAEKAVADALVGTECAIDAHQRPLGRTAGSVEHLGHGPLARPYLAHQENWRMNGS